MPDRVSPTDRIRARIDELFGQDRQVPEILEDVARLGAQLLMQAALEAEITEFLGRDRYQRAVACEDARPGSRNGYREVTGAAHPHRAGWCQSTHWARTRSSISGRSRFTTTGSWSLRTTTQFRCSSALALISWCGTYGGT
jgi:hypothetical protein